MQEETARTITISWGVAILMVGIAYFIGPYWAVGAVFLGALLVLWGHCPHWFKAEYWTADRIALAWFPLGAIGTGIALYAAACYVSPLHFALKYPSVPMASVLLEPYRYNETHNKAAAVIKDYFYLDVVIEPSTSAHFPLRLSAVNPGQHELLDVIAIIQDGSGSLWMRTHRNDVNAQRPANGIATAISREWSDRQLADIHTPINLEHLGIGENVTPVPFGVSPGVYSIELRTGSKTFIERLQILYRNAKWLRVIEVRSGGKILFSTPKPLDQPDITLEVYNATALTLSLRNTSDLLLKEPYCGLTLWNVAQTHLKDAPRVWQWDNKDGWIRPHEHTAIIVGLGNNTDPIYGYVTLTCPECTATKAYLIYIKATNGWYQELPIGQYPWGTDHFVKGMDDEKSYGFFIRYLQVDPSVSFGSNPRRPIVDLPVY